MTYIIPGIVVGSVWAIVASGLVLTYNTTRVLNLGYGAIAYALAECFYFLREQQGWGGVQSLLVTVGLVAPVLAVAIWWGIFRKLEGAGVVPTLVATIGLAVALPASIRLVFPHGEVFVAPGIVDDGSSLIRFWGMSFSADQISAIVGAIIVALGLAAMLRLSTLGLVMRATVDEPGVAQLMGTRTKWVSAWSWIVGCQLAGVGGVLLAPILQLDAAVFIELTIVSLSVALVAGLRSLPIAYLAAVGLGVFSGWLSQFSGGTDVLSTGLRPALSFIVIVGVLLLRRTPLDSGALRSDVAEAVKALSRATRLGGQRRAFILVAVASLALVVPVILTSYWRGIIALGFIYALIFLSFTVTLGRAGVLPLGQAAIVGLGAFAAGYATTQWNVPLLLAILGGAIFAAVCSCLLASVGLRLGVLEFGLLTLGFGVFCDKVVFRVEGFVPRLGYEFEPASLFGFVEIGSNTSLLYLSAIGFAIGTFVLWLIRQRGAGLQMEAMELNPLTAEASGISVRWYRLGAFMVGGFFAGAGGGLLGLYQRHLGPPDVVAFSGLVWLAVLVTMGRRTSGAALVGGLLFSILPALLAEHLSLKWGELPAIMFGLGGLALAMDPRGVVAATRGAASLGTRLVEGMIYNER